MNGEQTPREALATDERLACWVKDTCLLFGTTVETAYRVAALSIEGLKYQSEKTHAPV